MGRGRYRIVAVLTGDVIQSSRYSRLERRRVDRILRQSFEEVYKRFPGAIQTRFEFRITAGDEFQGVISDIDRVFEILMYLRARVATSGLRPILRFRASIGIGEMTISTHANPYELDGPAFVRSRNGLEEIDKSRTPRRWTKLVTGDPRIDQCADVLLLFVDHMQQKWTVPQWEAIRWALLDLTREGIAKKLKIAHQNVTKRLLAAGWHRFKIAAGFLSLQLRTLASPQSGATALRTHSRVQTK